MVLNTLNYGSNMTKTGMLKIKTVRARNNRCPGARGTEIFGRAPNEKVRFKPFIYPGNEIFKQASEFLYLGSPSAPNKNVKSSSPGLFK